MSGRDLLSNALTSVKPRIYLHNIFLIGTFFQSEVVCSERTSVQLFFIHIKSPLEYCFTNDFFALLECIASTVDTRRASSAS